MDSPQNVLFPFLKPEGFKTSLIIHAISRFTYEKAPSGALCCAFEFI
tara:strand:+ start:2417 stop:2557 length:141 start_codon:yes stop_codon:yes gene_type:complete